MARGKPEDPVAVALGNVTTVQATPTDRTPLAEPTIAPDTEFGGRYRIHRLLGRGGMGAVYEATDTNLRRQVALKVVLPSSDGGTEGTARMLREARAMAALHHPNVSLIYDVGVHDGQVFLAMQLVAGCTLRAWLTTSRRIGEILEVLYRAGLGLAAAHAAGLVHRDFKPDNVLVSTAGTPLVTDFGLARGVGERVSMPVIPNPGAPPDAGVKTVTRTGAIVGTPAYMAPEQTRGENCDARADQFSFAIAAWEALYGQRPFAGTTWDELYDAMMKGEVAATPPTSRVSRTIRAALLRGLSPEPADRYASIDEMLAVFAEALAAPRRRRFAIRFAVIAVAAIAGTATVMMLGQRDERKVASRQVASAGASAPAASTFEDARTAEVAETSPPSDANVQVAEPSPVAGAGTAKAAGATTPPRSRTVAPVPSSGSAATPVTPPPPAVGSAAPQVATPDPDVAAAKLELLRQRRKGLDGRRKNRSLLVTDLPGLAAKTAAIDAALAAGDSAAASAALAAAEALIDDVRIDGPFVAAKHARLNAELQARKLPDERYQAIVDMFRAELRAYQSHRYEDANVLLNQIAKALLVEPGGP